MVKQTLRVVGEILKRGVGRTPNVVERLTEFLSVPIPWASRPLDPP